jgi:putative ATPase
VSQIIAEISVAGGRILRLIHGDLTKEHVDAIVNAANQHLTHGGGLAAAIVRAGGSEIQRESDVWVRDHGLVTHSQPAITGAGRLPCRFVIHAVGPVWGSGNEDAKLASAISGTLHLASERGLASLALPAISTGIFHFPKARAAGVIIEAIGDFLNQNPNASLREIRITIIDQPTIAAFRSEFARRWPESIIIE